ncbi:MAG: MBL fold metallo-hydrolase, partial [Anaerolineae bacterium]
MRIESHLYCIGSGAFGFDLSDPYDCNIYLFDAGSGYVVFDIGTGLGIERILEICRQDGLMPQRIAHLFLTHAHSDHAGGAAYLRERVPDLTIYASAATARILSTGDEMAVCLPQAKAAGMYPSTYLYRACPVDRVLEDGDAVQIGCYTVQAIATPGHSHDHQCYLVSDPERHYLISGDALFFGGKIILQNTYDCSVPDTDDGADCVLGCFWAVRCP